MKKIIRNSVLTIVIGIMFSSCIRTKVEASSGGMSVLSRETGEHGFEDYSAVVNGQTIIPFGSNVAVMKLVNGCFIVTFGDDRGVKLIDSRGNDLLPQYKLDEVRPLGKYFSFCFYLAFTGDYIFGICDAQGKLLYEPESVLRAQRSIELLDAETAMLRFGYTKEARIIDLRNGEIIVTSQFDELKILPTNPLTFCITTSWTGSYGKREVSIVLFGRNGDKNKHKLLNSRTIGSIFFIDKGQNFINYYTPDKQYVGYIDLETGVEEITEEITGW